MPEQYSPSPEDRAPEHPEQSDDAFLEGLGEKLDQPYTLKELANQGAAAEEIKRLVPRKATPVETPPTEAEKEALRENKMEQDEHWKKLSPEIKQRFAKERALFVLIGKIILKKSGDDALVSLAEQARQVHADLGQARETFISGVATEKAFAEAVQIAVGQLEEIEQRLTTHP